jgi:dienelactone hydrolase
MPDVPAGTKVPAVVLSHGSGGISPAAYDGWRPAFNRAGIALFVVDSFKPRGVDSTVSDQGRVTFPSQIADALNALRVLANHPQIDRTRIFIIGMSRGGGVAFDTAWPTWQRPVDTNGAQFAGHIALYPSGCDVRFRTDDREKMTAPVFMALADVNNEDWQNGNNCIKYAEELARKGNPIVYKEYKGTYHGFDTNNRYATYQAVSSKSCNIEVYMTTTIGTGVGNNAYDFGNNRPLANYAEFFNAIKQNCTGTLKNARAGGDASAQREVVRDTLQFIASTPKTVAKTTMSEAEIEQAIREMSDQ